MELFATPVAPGRARFLSVTGGGPPPPRPPGPPSLKSLPFIASAMWVSAVFDAVCPYPITTPAAVTCTSLGRPHCKGPLAPSQ